MLAEAATFQRASISFPEAAESGGLYRGSSDPLGFEKQIGGMTVVHGRLSNIEEDVARDMIRGENSRPDR